MKNFGSKIRSQIDVLALLLTIVLFLILYISASNALTNNKTIISDDIIENKIELIQEKGIINEN